MYLSFFNFIMVFIPGDGMIQEEELEAVVRACLQVQTRHLRCPSSTLKFPIKIVLRTYNHLDVYLHDINRKVE